MDKKNHQPKNVSHQSNILWDEKLRKEGASWVQKDNFWLFGTLTFYEQRKGIAFEDERQRQLRFLFNALDRNLLPRRFTHTHLKKDRKLKECYNKRQHRERHKATFRLERVVFDELGKGRHLSHAHFFIKGTKTGYKWRNLQTQLITDFIEEHWLRFGTLDIRKHDNTRKITGYGYKEEADDLKRLRRSKHNDTQHKTITGSFNNTCSFLLI
ncbi:MAG: hypothetical protein P8Q50_13255 [Octadecabacter sp.]|nr:hypothetical protein [Octadecabacter sp.]